MKVLNALFVLIMLGGIGVFAQNAHRQSRNVWRVSEAYTVLVKEKAKAAGDLYEAREKFMAESIQLRSAQLRFTSLNSEIKKLSRTTYRNVDKFSEAYGELILAKIRTEVELYELRLKFTPEYTAFRRKSIELESLNSDIKQINKNLRRF